MECPARTLSEIQLQNLVLEAINKVLEGKQRAIKVLETNISEVVGNAHSEELERVKQKIETQQTLLVKMTASSGRRGCLFFECIEKTKEVRYNKLSDKCNLLKAMQTEEI